MKNICLETERLKLHVASRDEMENLIDTQTDDVLKTAYREMLQGCLDDPSAWEWHAVWIIELKDGTRVGDLSFKGLDPSGVAEIGDDDRILAMTEKPQEPKSHWCTPPFYFYRREDLKLVKSSVDAGCGVDAPGSLLAWLATQVPVYAYLAPGARHDIGDLESYKIAQKLFEERGL